MQQSGLPLRAQQLLSVYGLHIGHCHHMLVLHPCVVGDAGKEKLHMVGNSDPQPVVDSLRDAGSHVD